MRGFISAGLAALASAFALQVAHAEPQAIVVLQSASDSTVSGTAAFHPPEGENPLVRVDISLQNLAPNSEHGFHIHAFGDISDPKGLATGGHFNPFNTTHACEDSEVRHAGDIGNVKADAEGNVVVTKHVKASLIPGEPDSIFGRGVIVHEKADDCVTQPTGNAGGRFAQGVIGYSTNSTAKASPSRPLRRILNLAARAVIAKTAISPLSITGTVTFTTNTKTTFLHLNLTGFEPNGVHGFHIHGFGNLSSTDGTALGGHFNPKNQPHGLPEAGDARHAGDFGSITADANGAVITTLESDLISLDPSADTAIYGRAIVVHELVDDGTTQPTGNAGKRLAQGVIGVANITAVAPPVTEPTSTATYELPVETEEPTETDGGEYETEEPEETNEYETDVESTETSGYEEEPSAAETDVYETETSGYEETDAYEPVSPTDEETEPAATETEGYETEIIYETETSEETQPVATETDAYEPVTPGYEQTEPAGTETEVYETEGGYEIESEVYETESAEYEETEPAAVETESVIEYETPAAEETAAYT
ncbi:hypothetical protein HK097_005981 [Rhizophlyctis rosea]|uniref:Superoxide dismutase copper/zinc binding domain-containing protein n=1 Tax=Rhizophlyctis rosea TaxID=64517 RepID=A0AAD5SEP8_9FUNG|nr:hypothetical protein HK097_005981 [Rhizophlyctis rosea]